MENMQTCQNCKKEFQGRAGAKYCSSVCRQAAYRQRHDPRPRARRSPLRESVTRAQLELGKSVGRIMRLMNDDRFPKLMKDDPHLLRADIVRSIDELQAIVDEIDELRNCCVAH